MFEMFTKLVAFTIAIGLVAAAAITPNVEFFNRAKSGPTVGRVVQCDAQTTPPAVFTAGGGIYAERAGFEPAVQFSCTQHFQCCTFGHSVTSPKVRRSERGILRGRVRLG